MSLVDDHRNEQGDDGLLDDDHEAAQMPFFEILDALFFCIEDMPLKDVEVCARAVVEAVASPMSDTQTDQRAFLEALANMLARVHAVKRGDMPEYSRHMPRC